MALIIKEKMWESKRAFLLKTKFSSFFTLIRDFVITLSLLFGDVSWICRNIWHLRLNSGMCPHMPFLNGKKIPKWWCPVTLIDGLGGEISSIKALDIFLSFCAHKRTERISTRMCPQERAWCTWWGFCCQAPEFRQCIIPLLSGPPLDYKLLNQMWGFYSSLHSKLQV